MFVSLKVQSYRNTLSRHTTHQASSGKASWRKDFNSDLKDEEESGSMEWSTGNRRNGVGKMGLYA